MDLLLPEFLMAMGEVLTSGAIKYSDYGWKTVPNAEAEYTGATFRHLMKAMMGQTVDDESGESHYAHIAADAMVLFWYELEKKRKLAEEKVTDSSKLPLTGEEMLDTPVLSAIASRDTVTVVEATSKEVLDNAPSSVFIKLDATADKALDEIFNKPDIHTLVGGTGMFWDYETSSRFFGKLLKVTYGRVNAYPFRTTLASGLFKNFYRTDKKMSISDMASLDPNKLYTKADVKENK